MTIRQRPKEQHTNNDTRQIFPFRVSTLDDEPLELAYGHCTAVTIAATVATGH